MMYSKVCTKCGIEYPATPEFFSKSQRGKYGLRGNCKQCESAYNKEHHARIADKLRKYNQQWEQSHAEYRREYRRKWRSENPDKVKENHRRWIAENPERNAAKERNRRAKKRASQGRHSAQDVKEQLKRQSNRCYYCNCKMVAKRGYPNSQTVDHVIPLDRGGRNSPDNLVIACARCNFSKNNRLPHEWAEGGRLL
jgi:5-methylcytosine-specific restriction endonuclease McrA